jgi:hypothetical protein
VISLVVLYGCQTWCLTLREEYRLWALVDRVLSKMYQVRPEEIRGTCSNFQNEELQYPSQNLMEGLRQTTYHLDQDSLCLGRDLNGT